MFWKRKLTARMQFLHFATADENIEDPNEGQEGGGTGGDPEKTPEGGNEKRFTQKEMDAIIQDRLNRQKRKDSEEAKQKEERSKLDAADLAKAEKADAEKKATDAEARAEQAEWRADLSPYVVDSKKAVLLLDREKHVQEDGSVDVKAFLKDNPFMKRKGRPVDPEDGEDPDLDDDTDAEDPQPRRKSTGPGAGGTQSKKAVEPDSWAEAQEQDRKAKRRT